MSLRIGGNIPSLYNTTRINQTADIDRASRVEQKEALDSQLQENRGNAGQYISQGHGGVIQTRVSDTNAFKKAQLDGSRDRIEDIAEKLYSKLPDIFADMKKLPSDADVQTNTRVSVNERNVAAVADKQASQEEQLLNFAL